MTKPPAGTPVFEARPNETRTHETEQHRLSGRMAHCPRGAARAGEGQPARGDRLAAAKRELPRLRIQKSYVFETKQGRGTLPELFNRPGASRKFRGTACMSEMSTLGIRVAS